ncbi:MAG: iron-containing alcohol dehydrogenase [Verrucomicrobiota bacterium]
MSTAQHDSRSPAELSALATFDFKSRTRLIFGIDSVERVGELAKQLPAKRILLVTDAGIVAAGHAERVQKLLEAERLAVFIFDQVRENPTTSCVDRCLEVAKINHVDAIVGLGGGSSMDTAKGCNFLLTNGGEMKDYWGVGKARKAMLPLIAIPTTAGTGSECQSAALIADEITHQKMACLDPKAAARVAILDPELTLSQPARVTACTGIDAIAHAVETAVTKKRNPLSILYSREAFRLTAHSFSAVLKNPNDLEARGRMLLGAAFAGTAIENSMLGAAHSAANPLTAHYGIAHGKAVGMMLPHVVRFNGEQADAQNAYADLAELAGISAAAQSEIRWLALIDWLNSILEMAQMSGSLAECGVERSKISDLASEASKQWTAEFNPRKVTQAHLAGIYEAAFEGR